MRWLLVLLVMLLVFNRAGHWLERIGLGRLPGDLRWRWWGREFFLPLASATLMALVLFVLLALVGRLK